MTTKTLKTILTLLLAAIPLAAQTPQQMPPDYRGPQVHIPGIFVTPIPGAPFTAKVDIFTTQILPDGTTATRTTTNTIARDSRGRIYNERRQLVPTTFKAEPRLLEAHIYDPSTRISVFTSPYTHLARQMTLLPRQAVPTTQKIYTADKQEEDLGAQYINGVQMNGVRKTRLIAADASNTGKPVTISDEYWFSPDLSIYMLIKHDDIRTGTQYVAIKQVDRHEPDPSLFLVPTTYKVVDETPVPRNHQPLPNSRPLYVVWLSQNLTANRPPELVKYVETASKTKLQRG